MREAEIVVGNHFDKYRSSNPIHRYLIKQFVASARALLKTIEYKKVIEVGCGPGDLAASLFGEKPSIEYLGVDISQSQIDLAGGRYPGLQFRQGSAYELPVTDTYELCIACEVLEHLETPKLAIDELARVAGANVLISVPWEPTWRILNFCRGKYMGSLGNTPGHLQHFSRKSIRRLVERKFNIIAESRPFPWTMLLVSQPTSRE